MNPDSQNLVNPNPSPVQPAQPIKENLSSKIINTLRTRKKLVLLGVVGLVLAISIIIFGFSTIKNRFFPGPNSQSSQDDQSKATINSSSMLIKTTKSVFKQTEIIPVTVIASSGESAITAFDTVIEYDSEFLTVTKKNPPPLKEFDYYGKNDEQLIKVSAVRKVDGNSTQTFNNTILFDIEFTPKKKGKTVLKIIYMPGATNDSSLLNSASQDILSRAQGLEITIN